MNLAAVPFTPSAILDIGANVGGFYREAKAMWPKAMFVLIEGNPSCAPMLDLLGVAYYLALLSDTEKDAGMWIMNDAPTCTGASIKREKTEFFADGKAHFYPMRTTSLDKLMDGRRKFDLIKIDTQGSEIDIINGGLETIKQARGIIMEVSYEEYNEGAPLAEAVINRMAELGFFPAHALEHIIHPIKRHHIQDDMLFLNEKES